MSYHAYAQAIADEYRGGAAVRLLNFKRNIFEENDEYLDHCFNESGAIRKNSSNIVAKIKRVRFFYRYGMKISERWPINFLFFQQFGGAAPNTPRNAPMIPYLFTIYS